MHLINSSISPHACIPEFYGKQTQSIHEPDPSPPLSKYDTTRIQKIVGIFLYYVRAIGHTILVALNYISTMQFKPTQDTHHKN